MYLSCDRYRFPTHILGSFAPRNVLEQAIYGQFIENTKIKGISVGLVSF